MKKQIPMVSVVGLAWLVGWQTSILQDALVRFALSIVTVFVAMSLLDKFFMFLSRVFETVSES